MDKIKNIIFQSSVILPALGASTFMLLFLTTGILTSGLGWLSYGYKQLIGLIISATMFGIFYYYKKEDYTSVLLLVIGLMVGIFNMD